MCGSIPPPLQYAFMAWCSVKESTGTISALPLIAATTIVDFILNREQHALGILLSRSVVYFINTFTSSAMFLDRQRQFVLKRLYSYHSPLCVVRHRDMSSSKTVQPFLHPLHPLASGDDSKNTRSFTSTPSYVFMAILWHWLALPFTFT
jgi:hypothetical protein